MNPIATSEPGTPFSATIYDSLVTDLQRKNPEAVIVSYEADMYENAWEVTIVSSKKITLVNDLIPYKLEQILLTVKRSGPNAVIKMVVIPNRS